jgi:hypothetical protein
MIELLPLFFAGMLVFVLGIGAMLGAFVKAPLIRFLTNAAEAVPLWSLLLVVASEIVIMALSFAACLTSIDSGELKYEQRGWWILVGFLCCSATLYYAFALLPNLCLLQKITQRQTEPGKQFHMVRHAFFLAMPVQVSLFSLILLLYGYAIGG